MGGLDDQINVDVCSGERFKQARGDAGLIGDVRQRQHRLRLQLLHPIHRAPQLQAALPDRSFAAAGEQGSGFITPAGAHPHGNAVVPRDLHRPGVQHRGPQARQLQHLVAAHLRHQLGIRHLARIGAEHSGNVGVDLADIGFERGGQRDG